MLSTLAVDPGRNCTGWSLFFGTKLAACGLSVLPECRWKLGEVAKYHCFNVRSAVGHAHGLGEDIAAEYGMLDRVYVEEMSLNRGRDGTLSKAIATANDLLQLQSIGAFIAGRLGGELVYVPPAKHGKEVTMNRAHSVLEKSEADVLLAGLGSHKTSLWHNCYDAVLHGLRAVGRYG